jgi:predicted transcriptional regulator
MSDKRRVIDMVEQMSDSKPFDEILAELYIREKIERGLRDDEAGRVMSHEEARRRLSRWLQH